mgnify:FL=1
MSTKIFILCPSVERLKSIQHMYEPYPWAVPIVIEKQGIELENNFWEQLIGIRSIWENCEMVGTMSNSCYKKINLQEVNNIIINRHYRPNRYHHFMDSNVPIPNNNTQKHPYFNQIWNDMLKQLNLKTTTENNANYWMCHPILMKKFIIWYTQIMHPTIMEHPYILSDAQYQDEWGNHDQDQNSPMMKIWGKPYFPHFPFVVERLNKCFFETYYPGDVLKKNNFDWKFYIDHHKFPFISKSDAWVHYYTYGQFCNMKCVPDGVQYDLENELVRYNNKCSKIVFLISHDRYAGGAQTCLANIERLYNDNGITTIMIYKSVLDLDPNFDIVRYILDTAAQQNMVPVVICNTIVSYEIVEKLSHTNILTYWYIHEWIDDSSIVHFESYLSNHHVFESRIKKIFVCDSGLANMKEYIPNITNSIILYNTHRAEHLYGSLQKYKRTIQKDPGTIYLSIIGTVETRKNQQAFIDHVFYPLCGIFRNIKLLLVGRIECPLQIRPGYEPEIIQTGMVENALPYIHMADICISYSVNEVLPMNLIESMFLRKPIISTNVGGISEMITDQHDGFLIDMNDHTKCNTIINMLLMNPQMREYIGKNANARFWKQFSHTATADIVLDFLTYR